MKVSSIGVHHNVSQFKTKRKREDGESFIDLDSHADTCVLGNNALIVESPHSERTALVSFADPSVGTKTKRILSGAFKYKYTL